MTVKEELLQKIAKHHINSNSKSNSHVNDAVWQVYVKSEQKREEVYRRLAHS